VRSDGAVMAIDKSLIRAVDRVFYRAVTGDLPREHVDRYVKHLATIAAGSRQ
jgi:hypothetical protein